MTNILVLVGLFILFPVIALGAFRRPSLGLAVLVFSLPLLSQARRLFLERQAPFLSLETIAVLLLWIFVQLHNIRHRAIRKRTDKDWGVVVAASAFLFAGFVSATYAYDSEIAFKILITGGLIPVLCFFIARQHLNSKEDANFVIIGFFGLVVQVAIFTALAWGQRQIIAPQYEDFVTWLYLGANPVNIFGSPSASIATIVASIPLAAWYRVYGRWNNNLIWVVVSVSTLGVAAMSLSRGSWLGILVALVLSLPLYFKRIQMRAVILMTFFLLGFYFSGYYDFIFKLFDYRLTSQINTMDMRLANYQLALQAMTKHGFSGLGLGNYQYVYREFPSAIASRMQPLWFAHSLFLTLIPEMGLLGALAFAYIFVSRLIKGFVFFSQKSIIDYDRWFVFSLLVSIFSYVVVVSTSGGHLIATLTDYLIAPALIVIMTFLGCLSANINNAIPDDHIKDSSSILGITKR
jgi:hypothetical protein